MNFDVDKIAAALDESWRTNIQKIEADGVTALVADIRNGDGRQIINLKSMIDQWRDKPERVVGIAQMQSPDSFAELVVRQKNEATALFCDMRSTPSLTAVIDYHGAGAKAEWAKHSIHYAFPLSDEWKFWLAVMAKGRLNQEDFAFLIDERIADVVKAADTGPEPELAEMMGVTIATPAELLTLSRGLQIRVSQVVKEARNTSSGADTITFEETHEGENGQPLKVPGMFFLSIPIFVGDEPARIPVRLRYRVVERKTFWIPQLYRPDLILRETIMRAAEKAAKDTALPLFYGSPEA